MNDIVVTPDLGCAYRWNEVFNTLEWCPLSTNGLLHADEWGPIDEDIVGDEVVQFKGMDVTLSQVYRHVEKILGRNQNELN